MTHSWCGAGQSCRSTWQMSEPEQGFTIPSADEIRRVRRQLDVAKERAARMTSDYPEIEAGIDRKIAEIELDITQRMLTQRIMAAYGVPIIQQHQHNFPSVVVESHQQEPYRKLELDLGKRLAGVLVIGMFLAFVFMLAWLGAGH